MGLFEGKKGLILGVANDRSIAWAIAQKIMAEGGECGFTHLPDREDDDKKKNHPHRRVNLVDGRFLRDIANERFFHSPSLTTGGG